MFLRKKFPKWRIFALFAIKMTRCEPASQSSVRFRPRPRRFSPLPPMEEKWKKKAPFARTATFFKAKEKKCGKKWGDVGNFV